jgi:hypothetical protein
MNKYVQRRKLSASRGLALAYFCNFQYIFLRVEGLMGKQPGSVHLAQAE